MKDSYGFWLTSVQLTSGINEFSNDYGRYPSSSQSV